MSAKPTSKMLTEHSNLVHQSGIWRQYYYLGNTVTVVGLSIITLSLGMIMGFDNFLILLAIIFLPSTLIPLLAQNKDLMEKVNQLSRLALNPMFNPLHLAALLIGLTLLPIGFVLTHHSREYSLSYADRLFLRFYEISSLMQMYLERNVEAAKKSAVGKLKHLINRIENDWQIPSELFFFDDQDIAKFEDNLAQRVMPAVQRGDKESISALNKICEFLLSGKQAQLADLNDWMKRSLTAEKQQATRKFELSHYRRSLKDLAFAIVLVVTVSASYYLSINVFSTSKGEGLNVAATLLVGILGIYVTILRKER